MPDAPAGEYETRDLPLVAPGEHRTVAWSAWMHVRRTPSAASRNHSTNPDAADPVSTATPLGNDGGVVTAPLAGATPASGTTAPAAAAMSPAPTAGGDFAVNFGAFSTTAAADSDHRLAARLAAAWLSRIGNRRWQVRAARAHRPVRDRAEAEAARLRAAHVRDDVGAKVVTLDADSASAKPAVVAPVAKPVATTVATTPAEAAKPAAPAPKPVAASGTGFAVQLAASSKAPTPPRCATGCAAPDSAPSPRRSAPTRAR